MKQLSPAGESKLPMKLDDRGRQDWTAFLTDRDQRRLRDPASLTNSRVRA